MWERASYSNGKCSTVSGEDSGGQHFEVDDWVQGCKPPAVLSCYLIRARTACDHGALVRARVGVHVSECQGQQVRVYRAMARGSR